MTERVLIRSTRRHIAALMFVAVALAMCVLIGFATRSDVLFLGAFLGLVAVSCGIAALQFAHQRVLLARQAEVE